MISQSYRMVRPPSVEEAAAFLFQRPQDAEEMLLAIGRERAFRSTQGTRWSLPYAKGTFTRTAGASYQTGIPTDGSSAFLAFASTNVAVYEDLGDGAGALLRIEGARTNGTLDSENFGGAQWGNVGTTLTTGQTDPLAGTAATRAQAPSGTNTIFDPAAGGTADGNPYTISCWIRAKVGTETPNLNLFRATGGRIAVSTSVTTTYKRVFLDATTTNTEQFFGFPVDGRDWSGIGGVAAGARDVLLWGWQRESGLFPSSYIRCLSASGPTTRDADDLRFTATQLPARFFTGVHQFSQVSPIFGSADLTNGDVFILWGMTLGNDAVVIEKNAGSVLVSAFVGGVRKASSQALTFSRNGLLGVVKWDPIAGVITVNGVAGPTGTAWSWTPDAVRIGGFTDSAGAEAFCRFGVLQSV